MKNQVFNPYLPSYEYIPDAEPRLFGNRVYIYGSHDRYNGYLFCLNDYVCYSAPADDLSDWKYEGVIYKKTQDPKNRLGNHLLFAPDVVQGYDGRYYMYYSLDFFGLVSVAVCDTPAGKYKFYGYVHYNNGVAFGRRNGDQFPFDPGALCDDDGKVYLYTGFYKHVPFAMSEFTRLKHDGGTVTVLERDMVTISADPKVIFPKKGKNSFKGHEFFEASSIRKINGLYYFVYSSVHNHELCYAFSEYPDRDFVFGGTLVSLGDLYLDGNSNETNGVNYLGNTHGGILSINDTHYIFYHRQTNRHSYSRQACAEKLKMTEDGKFLQAEVTSCGLNDGPLKDFGLYEARIACNLWSKDGVRRYDLKKCRRTLKKHPYFTQSGKDRDCDGDQYIANIRSGSVVGFKYFAFRTASSVMLEIRGEAKGTILVSENQNFSVINGLIHVESDDCKDYHAVGCLLRIEKGVKPLYFRYEGQGYIDLKSIMFN